MDKVGGAIERVDDPEVAFTFAGAGLVAALFTQEPVVGIGLLEYRDNGAFCRFVDVGHIVVGALGLYFDDVQAAGMPGR